jgi:hypothetical protein
VPNVVKNPLDMLRALSAALEDMTRLGEFARAVDVEFAAQEADRLTRGFNTELDVAPPPLAKRGYQKAAAASRDLTIDFARHGAKTAALRALAAFWNARIQGYDRLFRAAKKRPVKFGAAAFAGITVPSVLLYYVNRDDPEYWEIPQWQRDLFWCVKLGGRYWRIPKPFELGLVFGTIPERVLEWKDSQDATGVRTAITNTIARETTSTFMPIPTAITPLIENLTNYSLFLERPLIPRGLENVEPELQYDENRTSEIAKGLGRLLNYPPAKIDNVFQAYTGGLGRSAVQYGEAAARKLGAGDGTPRAAKPIAEQLPGVKGFAVEHPRERSESVERFYNELEKVERVDRTRKLLEKRGAFDELDRYEADNQDAIADYDFIRTTADQLAELRAQMQVIRRDPDMTPEAKRGELEAIGQQMQDIARDAIARRYPKSLR